MIEECGIDVGSENTGQVDKKEDGKQEVFDPNSPYLRLYILVQRATLCF